MRTDWLGHWVRCEVGLDPADAVVEPHLCHPAEITHHTQREVVLPLIAQPDGDPISVEVRTRARFVARFTDLTPLS